MVYLAYSPSSIAFLPTFLRKNRPGSFTTLSYFVHGHARHAFRSFAHSVIASSKPGFSWVAPLLVFDLKGRTLIGPPASTVVHPGSRNIRMS